MKKVLALTLVLVLALGMSTMAFAANQKATSNSATSWYGSATDIDYGDTYVGATANIAIPLLTSNFTLDSGTPPNNIATVGAVTLPKRTIEASNMTVRLRASKGSQVIDKYEIVKDAQGRPYSASAGTGSYVSVKFVNPFVSNNPDGVDFAFRVYLQQGSTNLGELAFSGNYRNDKNDDYGSDTDYYDFYMKNILVPSEFIRVFDGDLGDGVHFNMRGIKGAKYYAYAEAKVKDADMDTLVKYNAIDEVYHLYMAGNFSSVVNYVTFEDADPTAYVYDKDLNYLGRANSKITTLSDTYYLASAQLDVDDAEEEPEPDDEGPDYEPDDWNQDVDHGGDDLYPENPHDNPGTGK